LALIDHHAPGQRQHATEADDADPEEATEQRNEAGWGALGQLFISLAPFYSREAARKGVVSRLGLPR
jgi:hypothetical protein